MSVNVLRAFVTVLVLMCAYLVIMKHYYSA